MREFIGFKKGINLGGWLSQSSLEKEHLETFIVEKDLENIASMGADHIRLPIDYPLIETEEGSPIEQGYDYIDRCVSWCDKYGLNMILDLHKQPDMYLMMLKTVVAFSITMYCKNASSLFGISFPHVMANTTLLHLTF